MDGLPSSRRRSTQNPAFIIIPHSPDVCTYLIIPKPSPEIEGQTDGIDVVGDVDGSVQLQQRNVAVLVVVTVLQLHHRPANTDTTRLRYTRI